MDQFTLQLRLIGRNAGRDSKCMKTVLFIFRTSNQTVSEMTTGDRAPILYPRSQQVGMCVCICVCVFMCVYV